MQIEYIVNESGDWSILRIDEEEHYSGHSIPDFVWMDLINKIAVSVATDVKRISDQDMEEGNY